MESTQQIRRRIAEDRLLRAALERIEPRLSGDPGHDLGHLLRVALWTIRLGEGRFTERAAIAAALLHDVVNPPKGSPEARGASERAADFARDLLTELSAEVPVGLAGDTGFSDIRFSGTGFPDTGLSDTDLSASWIAEVCGAIRDHSFSRGATPSTALGKALQDADRLDALGAIGVLRTVSIGVGMGSRWFDPDDPWAEERPLDDKAYTIDHFFAKLLRLPATMQTEGGRIEAENRAAFLREFLRRLGDEIGHEVRDPTL